MAVTGEERPGRTGRRSIVALAVVFEGGLAPLALALGWALGRPPLVDFAWRGRDAAIGVAATLPMFGALALGLRLRIGPLVRIRRFIDAEVRPLLGSCPWPDLALIALAAGVGEEMLFRGALQGGLARALGAGGALVASSLLFGLLHPITPGYVVLAGSMGAYLGLTWLATGNLLAPIVAHALYDFLALLFLLRTPPDAPAPGE